MISDRSGVLTIYFLIFFIIFYTKIVFTFENTHIVTTIESDGFDFPIGSPDNHSGWYISLYLGQSWSSYYGHLGEDFLKNTGSSLGERVNASSNGEVYKIYTGSPNSWGGVIILKHISPTSDNFDISGCTLPNTGQKTTSVVYTLYAHLQNISVSEGDEVLRGAQIGEIGYVPDFPTPHLHFEVKNQTAVDTEWMEGVGHGYSGTDNYAPNHFKPSQFINQNREIISGQSDEIIVKGSSPDIFFLKNNILHRLTDWNNIYLPLKDIYGDYQQKSDSELANYHWGSQIIADGLICKHKTDSKIYLIQYDQKRLFTNESAYTQRGYKLQGGDPVSPTVINLPDGMLSSLSSGPTITTNNVNVQADLYFKKGNQRTNTFQPGDNKSTFIELKAGDGYTSYFYLRIKNPDGSQYYASYSNSTDIPNTPFASSPNKVPLLKENGRPKTYNIVPGNWNNPWNFNNYTLPTTTAPGTYTWEYWYEDVNKPGIILCKDTESYTVQSAQDEITITFQSVPSGRIIKIDNQNYTTPKSFTWNVGSSHIISTDQTQLVGSETKYIFTQWSDGAARTHAITASVSTPTYTAYFASNFLLTTAILPADAGTISTTSGWYSNGTTLQLSAQPAANTNYSFSYWSGDLSGNQNPISLIIDAPKTVTANFINIPPKQITVTTSPAGLPVTVDGTQYTAPYFFNWNVGERHTIGVNKYEPKATGERLAFESWSDGGARTHDITVPAANAIYYANFITEY
ncbi:M23 family metallopeptidase, partial [candidate division KSB1 bacterium]|nr:M23 family metallopeptidase [candidate division KSB1 bacterium]